MELEAGTQYRITSTLYPKSYFDGVAIGNCRLIMPEGLIADLTNEKNIKCDVLSQANPKLTDLYNNKEEVIQHQERIKYLIAAKHNIGNYNY